MLPLVIYVEDVGGGGETQHVFESSPVRIGRSPMNDLVLGQGFVSQFHGLVRFEDASTVYVDLGSTNGTHVHGRRVARNEPVDVGDETPVTIGSERTRITLRFAREERAPQREPDRFTQFRALASLAREEEPPRGPAPLVGADETMVRPPAEPPSAPAGRGPPSLAVDAETGHHTAIASPADIEEAFRQPRPEGKTPTGVHRALVGLGPLYEAYREAWGPLLDAVGRSIRSAPASQRGEIARQIASRFPALAQEPEFERLAEECGVPLGRGAKPIPIASGVDAGARELLNKFVASYVPEAEALESKREFHAFLARLAEVLEAFGNAFVELRRGHDQFGTQMAVPTTSEVTPLHRAKGTREVLSYVLDWKESSHRVQELMGGFVDVMIHQIALLSGMQEGARGLLMKLSPEELAGRIREARSAGLLARLGIGKSDALWEAFLERHRELLEEEQELTRALFGPEFARAYVMIVGERSKRGEEEGAELPARGHARG